MNKPRVLDLFSGCGGMSWGFQRRNFTIIGAIDNASQALKTFKHNHPDAYIAEENIEDINANEFRQHLGLARGDLECLVGGPPCQGFSKNVPAKERFLEDSRNQLFREFIHFVDRFLPKTVLMENVPPIYTAYEGQVRDEIVEELVDLGYEVTVSVLFAPDYGVPQKRRRCFFFASRTGLKPEFPEPQFTQDGEDTLFGEKRPYISAWEAISDLPVLENGEGNEPIEYKMNPTNEYQRRMRRNSDILYDHVAKDLSDKQFKRVCSLKPGQAMDDLPEELQPKSGYSGAYGRLDFEMLAPTITRWVFHPGSGRFFHPSDLRLITIREAARLQGFSDDFRFTGTYNQKAGQVGNAVPPVLISHIADEVNNCLEVKTEA